MEHGSKEHQQLMKEVKEKMAGIMTNMEEMMGMMEKIMQEDKEGKMKKRYL